MRMSFARRVLVTTAVMGAAVGLAAGPASAHMCFKTALNERAAAGMAGSHNFMTFADIATSFIPGLCPAGVEILADAGGATPTTLINSHGTMAGGTLKKGADSGTKSISHLDIEAVDAAVPTALEACEV